MNASGFVRQLVQQPVDLLTFGRDFSSNGCSSCNMATPLSLEIGGVGSWLGFDSRGRGAVFPDDRVDAILVTSPL